MNKNDSRSPWISYCCIYLLQVVHMCFYGLFHTFSTVILAKNFHTVKILIFVGYQFLCISWLTQTTKLNSWQNTYFLFVCTVVNIKPRIQESTNQRLVCSPRKLTCQNKSTFIVIILLLPANFKIMINPFSIEHNVKNILYVIFIPSPILHAGKYIVIRNVCLSIYTFVIQRGYPLFHNSSYIIDVTSFFRFWSKCFLRYDTEKCWLGHSPTWSSGWGYQFNGTNLVNIA